LDGFAPGARAHRRAAAWTAPRSLPAVLVPIPAGAQPRLLQIRAERVLGVREEQVRNLQVVERQLLEHVARAAVRRQHACAQKQPAGSSHTVQPLYGSPGGPLVQTLHALLSWEQREALPMHTASARAEFRAMS